MENYHPDIQKQHKLPDFAWNYQKKGGRYHLDIEHQSLYSKIQTSLDLKIPVFKDGHYHLDINTMDITTKLDINTMDITTKHKPQGFTKNYLFSKMDATIWT